MRGRNKVIGKSGEDLAAKYLMKGGYRILNRNYTTSVGEIDIVATDERTLIFVEVKTRKNTIYGTPAEAVGNEKMRKISQVAAQYIKRFMLYGVPVRFDVIEVYLENNAVSHIENAFDSYLKY